VLSYFFPLIQKNQNKLDLPRYKTSRALISMASPLLFWRRFSTFFHLWEVSGLVGVDEVVAVVADVEPEVVELVDDNPEFVKFEFSIFCVKGR
jgi:hypothetical protein